MLYLLKVIRIGGLRLRLSGKMSALSAVSTRGSQKKGRDKKP